MRMSWSAAERCVCRELDAARGFGARYLNIHIGSHKGTGIEAGIDRVGESLARILDDRPRDEGEPRLVLEDSAGQGGSVGVTIEELGAIMDAAGQHGADRSRLGICLDTAHLWGAGYELDAPEEIDRLIDTVGIARVRIEVLREIPILEKPNLRAAASSTKRKKPASPNPFAFLFAER